MTPAPPSKKGRQQKLLIYAGVAGAILGVLMLAKRKKGGTAEEQAGSSLPTYTSGPSSIPGAEGGNSGELATFENTLSAQLPQAIREGVQAGMAGNPANASTPNNLTEVLSVVTGLITALRPGGLGEQVGSASPSPSQAAPTPAPAESASCSYGSACYNAFMEANGRANEAAQHAAPAPAPKPAPKPTYHMITCGNGCPGHKYPDGHSACMSKRNGKCVWA